MIIIPHSKSYLFVVLFFASLIAIAEPVYQVKEVVADPNGGAYAVVEVKKAFGSGATPRFPFIVKFQKNGQVDTSYGEGGCISLKNLDGWPQVSVSDIKVDPKGRVYVLGALGSRESTTGEESTAIARGILDGRAALGKLGNNLRIADGNTPKTANTEADLDKLLARLESKYFGMQADGPDLKTRQKGRFERGKADTQKLFVTRINPNGKLDPTYGDSGIATVHNVLEHREDSPEKMVLKADGGVAFVAKTNPSDGKGKNWVVGHLKPQGDLDSKVGKKGLLTVPPDDLPKGREWYPVEAALNPDGTMTVIGHATIGNKDKFAEVTITNDGAEAAGKPISVRYQDGKGNRIEAKNLIALDPKSGATWMVAYDTEKPGNVSVKKYEAEESGDKKLATRLTAKENSLLEFKSILSATVNPDGSLSIIGQDDFNPGRVRGVTIDAKASEVSPASLSLELFDSHGSPYDNCIKRLKDLVPSPYPLRRAA